MKSRCGDCVCASACYPTVEIADGNGPVIMENPGRDHPDAGPCMPDAGGWRHGHPSGDQGGVPDRPGKAAVISVRASGQEISGMHASPGRGGGRKAAPFFYTFSAPCPACGKGSPGDACSGPEMCTVREHGSHATGMIHACQATAFTAGSWDLLIPVAVHPAGTLYRIGPFLNAFAPIRRESSSGAFRIPSGRDFRFP